MILQPLDRCVHYGRAYHKRYSTATSYNSSLHGHHFVASPVLSAPPRLADVVDLVHLVQ